MGNISRLPKKGLFAALFVMLVSSGCQVITATPGAVTPQLIAVYQNVSQGPVTASQNGQYIVMPSEGIILDVKMPYPTTLQVGIEPYTLQGCVGAVLSSTLPNDPATLLALRRSPGIYTATALNNVATDPYVIYRISITSTQCFGSVSANGNDPSMFGRVYVNDIPTIGHTGAVSAPALVVKFNGPPPNTPPGSAPARSCTVPSLIGVSAQNALSKLSQAGLQPSIMGLGSWSNTATVVTSQNPAAGNTLMCGSYVTIYEAQQPQQNGSSGVKIWNCNADMDTIELYVAKDSGVATDEGSMSSQYQNGSCGSTVSSAGKTINFSSGHQYQLFDVLKSRAGCSASDPTNSNCVIYQNSYTGNTHGPIVELSLP